MCGQPRSTLVAVKLLTGEMELKIKMMQSGLVGKLEEGRNRDSQLATVREETLRLEQENVRLRHRWANTVM